MRKDILSLHPECISYILLVLTDQVGRCLALVGRNCGHWVLLSIIGLGWLLDQEERYGALGWTLFGYTPEESITLVVMDEASIGGSWSMALGA